MNFRNFGKTGWQVSALGFGCMRLPSLDGKRFSAGVDEPEAVRLIRHAIEQGVNYLDTAYVYHDGRSEFVVGQALQDGYRDRVRLATKSPVWLIQSEADFDKFLNEQLGRLRTDHIDFYLLHALSRKRWREIILPHRVLEKAAAAVRDGRIGHLGFSFHDDYESLPEILAGYDRWAFCQLQYNYLDTERQAGTPGVRLAAAQGLAVVVMEPLLGGRLANPPADIREFLAGSAIQRSPVDWALQWLWDQPEVSVVLSGMSTMAQLEANLASAGRSGIGSFAAADRGIIEGLQTKYRQQISIPCTQCHYCLPCPNGINIPVNFELFNDAVRHEDIEGGRTWYGVFLTPAERAGACQGCRTCEPLCPQQIPISEWMPKVHALLGTA